MLKSTRTYCCNNISIRQLLTHYRPKMSKAVLKHGTGSPSSRGRLVSRSEGPARVLQHFHARLLDVEMDQRWILVGSKQENECCGSKILLDLFQKVIEFDHSAFLRPKAEQYFAQLCVQQHQLDSECNGFTVGSRFSGLQVLDAGLRLHLSKVHIPWQMM